MINRLLEEGSSSSNSSKNLWCVAINHTVFYELISKLTLS